MSVRQRWLVAALAVSALALSACSETAESSEGGDPAATIEEIEGSDVVRVILAPGSAERLGLEVAEVSTDPSGGTVIPYAAVVYDANGDTWVYTSPKKRTFERESITVTDIVGETAFLSAGPDAGTEVVTLGTAELFGVEQEIGA